MFPKGVFALASGKPGALCPSADPHHTGFRAGPRNAMRIAIKQASTTRLTRFWTRYSCNSRQSIHPREREEQYLFFPTRRPESP